VSIKHHLTLASLPQFPVRFNSYEDFLALTDKEMRQVVKGVSCAQINGLVRLFSRYFNEDSTAKEYGAALVVRTLLAIASGVARITSTGQVEFDVELDKASTFANTFVQDKVNEALPIINEVVCELMDELRSFCR